MVEIGRNDPCPCGSGQKYKKCCWQKKRTFLSATTQAYQRTSLRSRLYSFMVLGLIIIISTVAYSNSFGVPFVFDDGAHITQNRGVHLDNLSPAKIQRLKETIQEKGRSVAEISFAINYYFGKLNPFGYHLFNLMVHMLTAFCVYLLIKITLCIPLAGEADGPGQSPYERIAFQVAAASGLIFAVHTVNTQAVTYIVQRMTSMAALFFIISLLFYIKARQSHGAPRNILYLLSFISFWLALGSKQNVVTLPIYIVLYEVYFFRNGDWSWLKKRWYLVPTILGIILAVGLIYTKGDLFSHLFKGYETRPFTMGQRALTQLRVVVYYITLLFFPHPSRLNLDYDYTISTSLISPITTLPCLFIIFGLIGLGCYLMKRRPIVSFCIFWFFGNLVIESSIYPLDLVYEHRLYLPMLGFLCIVVMYAIFAIERLISSEGGQKIVKTGALVLVIGILTIWTHQRNYTWRSVVSILEDVVAKSPNNSRQHVNLGVAYSALKQLDKAIEQYNEGIRLDPNYPEAYNNLANAFNRKGMLDKAIAEYQKAIKMRYNYKEAHNNLGSAYYKKGMYDEAIKEHLIALKIQADCEKSLNNLGVAYSAKNNFPEAVEAFKKAIEIKPDFSKPYINLGLTYTLMGDYNNSEKYLDMARRLEPNNANTYYNLGNAYSDQGKHDKAVEAFSQAIRLNPNYDVAYNNMGLAYRQLGKEAEALAAYEQAIKINPLRAEFYYNMGLIHSQAKRYDKAIELFKKSLSLSPGLVRARFDLATTLEAKGNYPEAKYEYEEVLKSAPAHVQAHHKLGLLYINQFGDRDKSRFHLRRALQFSNDSNTKKVIEGQLSSF